MGNRVAKGIDLIEDVPGHGDVAVKGCTVTYNARFYLRRGDEVTFDSATLERLGERADELLTTRRLDGALLIDHETIIGKRRAIAAVEYSLVGMAPGGFREVMASAHLCWGEAGLGDLVPPNAMLRIQLWVHEVVRAAQP